MTQAPTEPTATATTAKPLRLILTGASGLVGSATLSYLLTNGHTVITTDISTLRPELLASFPEAAKSHHILDLTSIPDTEKLFDVAGHADGLIHFAAIPDPVGKDWRRVHNNNVTSSYNVLYTAMARGVKRVSQASSVNATGMSYTRDGMQVVDELPLTEKETYRAEDAYALSKQICEIQADSLCRFDTSFRVASLRFHNCQLTYDNAWPIVRWQDLWNWTSYESCAESALLGITSEGWEGHEAFHICADEIPWEGGVTPESRRLVGSTERMNKVGSVELIKHSWPGTPIREGWFDGEKGFRRATADTTKAKKLLGFVHRDGPAPRGS